MTFGASIHVLTMCAVLHGVAFGQAPEPRVRGTGLAMVPPNVSNPTAEAMGDEELQRLRDGAVEQPFASKPVPSRQNSFSLEALSSFLTFGDRFTMLPKGCVVNLPAELESRMIAKPAGKITPWPEFLAANRNWIRCVEVSKDQVMGKVKIPDDALDAYRKAKVLVVACHEGSPITVLSPPPAASP